MFTHENDYRRKSNLQVSLFLWIFIEETEGFTDCTSLPVSSNSGSCGRVSIPLSVLLICNEVRLKGRENLGRMRMKDALVKGI